MNYQSYKNRTLNTGETVKVYRNLTKSCFSIQAKRDGKWIVCAHTIPNTVLSLLDCTFPVSEKTRKRIIDAMGKKEVHAYVVGTLISDEYRKPVGPKLCTSIKYNPFHDTFTSFYVQNRFKGIGPRPIKASPMVAVTHTSVFNLCPEGSV